MSGWSPRRRTEPWQSFRIFSPIGGRQELEALQEFLTVLWGRALRSGWSRLAHGYLRLAYEVRAEAGDVQHAWSVPETLGPFIRDSLRLYRPAAAELTAGPPLSPGAAVSGAILRLKRPACFALAEKPVGAALNRVLARLQTGESALMQLLLLPCHDAEWRPQAHAEFRRVTMQGTHSAGVADRAFAGFSEVVYGLFGTTPPDSAPLRGRIDAVDRHQLKEAPAKLKDHGFQVTARVVTSAPTRPRAQSLLSALCAQFALLDDANQVHPKYLRERGSRRLWQIAAERRPGGRSDVWTCCELAALVDVPGADPAVQDGPRILELKQLPPKGEIYIGDGVYRGRRVPVELSRWALFQHLVIQGKTGSGKGVTQLAMALAMARSGLGFSIFFPLQADAQVLVNALPEEALKRLIFFEVGHPRWALPLNILKHDGTPEDQERVVEEALNLLVRLFGADAIQARSRMLLRAAMAGAAAMGGHLGDAERVLVDEQFRAKAGARIPNENTRRFLAQWQPGADRDAPLNKLAALTWSGPIAAMVAQPDALDWVEIIRTGKIVIASLNQERAGELACNLAAGGILNQMIRAVKRIPPAERAQLFHMALFDEFRIVAEGNESLWQEGFTQLRQFRFGIGAAGQYPSQLPPKVWQSVSGSAANKIVLFEEGSEAEICARLLGGDLTGKDLAHLPSLQGYANVLFAGAPGPDGRVPLTPSGPFTFLAPPLVKPLREWRAAADASMAQWCRRVKRSAPDESQNTKLEVE